MKVGLHTVDLFPGRERLMPFRTVLEVAKVMNEQGWKVDVLNSSVAVKKAKDFQWNGVNVVQCPRDFGALSQWVNDKGYDVFCFAATIREGLRSLKGFKTMKCRKIAYVPSGITPFNNAMYLFKKRGLYAKAWLLEALTPKKLLGWKLKRAGFTDIIGMTDYTTSRVNGFLNGHTIYPGKDEFEEIDADDTIVFKHDLKGSKFYLFTGGPAFSRGGYELLEAFDRMANHVKDAKLVFLVRQDVGGEYDELFHTLNGLKNRNNVLVLNERLTVAQLKAFFIEAYAVVLPFICIPAEIPITYYEVMSCGTPVISFPNAGTTEYLSEGLKVCRGVSIDSMKIALRDFWHDNNDRKQKSEASKRLMDLHPDWSSVALQWMQVIKNKD